MTDTTVRSHALPTYVSVVGVLAAGLATWCASFAGLPATSTVPLWALVVAYALAESGIVHLRLGTGMFSITMSEAVLVVGLLRADPRDLVVAAAVGPLVTMLALHRLAPVKLAFNTATNVVATCAALLVLHGAADAGVDDWRQRLPVLLAAVASSGVSMALVAGALRVALTTPVASSVGGALAPALLATSVNACLGFAVVVLFDRGGLDDVVLLLPALLAVYAGYRAIQAKRDGDARFALLEDTLLSTAAPTLDRPRVDEVLTIAVERLAGDIGVLAVDVPGGEPLVRSVADGVAMALDVDTATLDAIRSLARACDGAVVIERSSGLLGSTFVRLGVERLAVAELPSSGPSGVIAVGQRSRLAVPDPDAARSLQAIAAHGSALMALDRVAPLADEIARLRDELELVRTVDRLTGLPNLEGLLATLRARPSDEPVGVLRVRVHHLEEVNEMFGHDTGDEAVVRLARRLRACSRPGDEVARVDALEFAVVLGGSIDQATIDDLADRVRSELGRPVRVEAVPTPVRLAATVGSAVRPASQALALLDAAESSRRLDRVR